MLYTDEEKFRNLLPLGLDSIYSRLLGSEYDSVLSLIPRQRKKKIPNCSFKSHSQGHPSVTKLFLQGSQGDGGGCGSLPHALSPPALERCQVRTHREMVEPPTTSATSSQPAQEAANHTSSPSVGTALHTSSSQNKPKTPSTPSPPKKLFIPFKLQTV